MTRSVPARPALANTLVVRLYGAEAGHISRTASGISFEASAAGREAFGALSTVLSQSLPLGTAKHYEAAANFFGGLLPEGTGLSNLARQANCKVSDVFALVEFVGRDLAGAVSVGTAERQEPDGYRQLTDAEIEQRLNLINDYALGSVGGGGSLAGYQPKTTLAKVNGTWHEALGGAASTHILKPATLESADSLYALNAEAYCLRLGRHVGLSTFGSEVLTFGARTVLAIERYDRRTVDGRIERIHQEDSAQALGLPWNTDSKFEGSDPRANFENVAAMTRRRRTFRGGTDDREALLAYAAFNVAIGNTDAHAKNFSFLRFADGTVELAPLYDISATAFLPNGNQNMAMSINSIKYQPDISRADLVAEAASWGLRSQNAAAVVDRTLEQLAEAVRTVDIDDADERIASYIAAQTANLLDGKDVGVSKSQPPALVPLPPVVRRRTSA